MSNTKLRIYSAIVLVLIISVAIYLGENAVLSLLLVSGLLLVDEMMNMLKVPRRHLSYLFALISFVAGFILFNYLDQNTFYFDYFMHTGVALNTILISYLFFGKMDSSLLMNFMKKYSFGMGIFFLIPILNISFLIHEARWVEYITLMLLVNFLVDSGAWFFGKKYGNKKLWPEISPKKTIAGALGGIFVSVTLSSFYIYFVFNKLNMLIIVSLLILTMLAQMGDLIESKFKRQLSVKDSSQLIPGHGGIYDRLDSLIFIAPFYVIMIRYLF